MEQTEQKSNVDLLRETFIHNFKESFALAIHITKKPVRVWTGLLENGATYEKIRNEYLMVLAVIPTIAAFFSALVDRQLLFTTCTSTVLTYAFYVALPLIMGLIIEQATKYFEGETDRTRALKLAAYTLAPAYLGSAISLVGLVLYFLPQAIFELTSLGLGIYGIYLYFDAVPYFTNVPQNQRAPFTLATITITIIGCVILGVILSAFGFATFLQ